MNDKNEKTPVYQRTIDGITYTANIHFKSQGKETLLEKCRKLANEEVKKQV